MIRERALKVALVLVGLLFLAAIYPLTTSLWKMNESDYGDDMMLSLYFALGIFLLMAVLAVHIPSERGGLMGAAAVLVIIGITLIALAPAKQSGERASAPGA